MKVTFRDREQVLRDRLRARLDSVALLQCAVHGKSVEAVVIHGRENGWFDSMWTTCCEALEQQAAAIVKKRC
ncbi:MAG: hypothetical protein JWO56_785 [Acidobacteria bacterium]|nr:hypothetical protein [Acidobacteriota bacterium]